MSDDRVGAVHLKVATLDNVAARVGAAHLKVLAQNTVDSHVGAVHLKVLCQYPAPYFDGGDALPSMLRLRNKNSRSKAN